MTRNFCYTTMEKNSANKIEAEMYLDQQENLPFQICLVFHSPERSIPAERVRKLKLFTSKECPDNSCLLHRWKRASCVGRNGTDSVLIKKQTVEILTSFGKHRDLEDREAG